MTESRFTPFDEAHLQQAQATYEIGLFYNPESYPDRTQDTLIVAIMTTDTGLECLLLMRTSTGLTQLDVANPELSSESGRDFPNEVLATYLTLIRENQELMTDLRNHYDEAVHQHIVVGLGQLLFQATTS